MNEGAVSGYFFECPLCTHVTGLSIQSSFGDCAIFNDPPHRSCGGCGEDGCAHCIPDEVCETCAENDDSYEEGHDSLSCLACLRGWGH